MMSDKVSIRWKLCAYFMIFSVLLLLILWLMQTVLLNGIYGLYTRITIKQHAETIEENIDNPELNSLLVSLCQENEFSVYLLSEDGILKSATERSTSIRVDKASPGIYEYWTLASENGGTYVTEVETSGVLTDSGVLLEYEPSHFIGRVPQKNPYRNIIYSSEVLSAEGETSLLVVISRIEPIASMGEVLQIILVVTSFFAFFVSMVFAFIASKGLASPIKKLSRSANKLAAGDYNVTFEGGGCREITGLGNTLNTAAEKLRKTDNLRKELLANVSHDLRTPLTMIGGYGEMMRDIPGENNAENIQIIIDETKRLTRLVNDALDLSKLQSGTYNFRPSVFSVTDEAYDIVNQFEKLSAGKSRITFIHSGDILVKADETLVSEAIYNLVSNTVHHSGEASSVMVRQSVSGGKVRISIIDNGCGIPKEQLEDIWERYQKGFNSGGGTGLGLAIVKSAITLCGGTCGVMSNIGQGSEFWIELPIFEE